MRLESHTPNHQRCGKAFFFFPLATRKPLSFIRKMSAIWTLAAVVDVLKTTPTHGMKVGIRLPYKSEIVCHKFRFLHHILLYITGSLPDATPHFMAYFGGIFFANMGGGGCRSFFFFKIHTPLSFASQAGWCRMERAESRKWEKVARNIENWPRPDMRNSTKIQERKGHINLRKIAGTPAGCPWDSRRDKQGSTGRCPRDFLLLL